MAKIKYTCRLCGDIIDEEDYEEEVVLAHVLRRHINLLLELAQGMFEVETEDGKNGGDA